MWRFKILVGLSGSIACYKTLSMISALRKAGHEVKVAATASALKFVGAASIEGLTGHPPFVDTFENGRAMDHIDLARWADVVVVAPASASLLARLALGLADDALSTTLLALQPEKPLFIAPAMNVAMWEKPIVQQHVQTLRSQGTHILWPEAGALACGEVGSGRMMEPEDILAHVLSAATEASDTNSGDHQAGVRILITAGGTREPIDGVRFISNFSTGRTATQLAEILQAAGANVTFVHAEGVATAAVPMDRQKSFKSFQDLADVLKRELQTSSYDYVVHAAAVSDYSVESIEAGGQVLHADEKIKLSSDSTLNLRLKPNAKLIQSLKTWSKNPAVHVVGFKLTNSTDSKANSAAAEKLLADGAADMVVRNDLSDVQARPLSGRTFYIHRKNQKVETLTGLSRLAQKILMPYRSSEVSHDVVP